MNQQIYNKKNTGIDSRIIIIILACLVFLFVFYILIFKIVPSNKEIKIYNIELPMHADAKNKNLCPYNCVRGRCNLSSSVQEEDGHLGKHGSLSQAPTTFGKSSGSASGTSPTRSRCKHDYECNYCKDPKTNQFYVNNYQEKQIIHELEEEPHSTPAQIHTLNDDINGYNDYIHKLNNKIQKVNGQL